MLEAKEADMRRVLGGSGQVSSLKHHYDKVLQELEQERDQLQTDRADLLRVPPTCLPFLILTCAPRFLRLP